MTETEKMAVLSALNKRSAGTLMDLLGIEFIDVGDDFLTVKMTITPQTHQPAGIMHGGVSVVLGETAGSCLSNLLLGEGQHAVGCDITAHHLRPVRAGTPARAGGRWRPRRASPASPHESTWVW